MFVIAWAFLSALWSLEPRFSAGRAAAMYFESVLGIWIGFAFAPRQLMAVLAWTFALVLILNAGCALLVPAQGVEWSPRAGTKVWQGITINRNELGALAASAAIYFEVALLRERPHWLPGLGFALLAAIIVAMTYSATAVVLLSTFAPLTALLVLAKRLRLTYPTVAALALAGGCGAWYLVDHVATVTALMYREETFTNRTPLWREAVDLIRHSPFTGWGFDMVWGQGKASWFPDLPNTVGAYHAHNGYVQLATELGVPAAALALLLVLTLIAQAFATYARTGSAFALFCCLYFAMFAVGNLTESKLFFLLWPEWTIFTALAVAFALSHGAPIWQRARPRSGPTGWLPCPIDSPGG